MAKLTINDAIVAALRSEMMVNPKIFCLGQDIGQFGGALQTFKGLWADFKDTGRIIDAPISEEVMVGAGAGAAMCGMRPVVEIMFLELLNLCLGSVLNEIGQVYVKSAHRLKVPLVIRTKCGVGPHRGHAEDYHAVLTSVPGLKVVMPSEPRDAMGLMRSALREDNPVIFLEHMGLTHARRAEVPDDDDFVIPLGVADIKRPGSDVTIVSCGLMVPRALKAAEQLKADHSIDCEVIDLRTIAPLDTATILSSVKKTGHLVIAHEAWKTGGSGGEVAAIVAEQGFKDLKGPIVRIAPPNVPIPFSLTLEKLFIPNEQTIMDGVMRSLGKQ
ncbi:MAG: transketolase C-terminal domain-containing protein [Rhodospirillaceae bacterium]|nr:transketolase C-terminal domain-containing protein [Rhodospirillaceae bacterium]